MIRHIGKYRGKTIVFHPREAVMAHVDGQEIKQVVLNLIVNALESMDHQGTLRIDARYQPGMAEMIFADDGCGMEAEVLENIFEPFFTRRREGKGTGLGLSITHRIISQHDGEIMAVSPGAGKGRPFTVRLPILAAEIDARWAVDGSKCANRRRAEPAPASADLTIYRTGVGRVLSIGRREQAERHGGSVTWTSRVREDCGSCSPTTRPISGT